VQLNRKTANELGEGAEIDLIQNSVFDFALTDDDMSANALDTKTTAFSITRF
jgi:hypothetical protein